ncbi:hypothetical protein [Okeania sp. SIO2B3]|uniref:hypothetical protein n=1 Tax=Okeania sp. SIO2B3 TaxID=2607784 RepID=UPI0013BEE4A7|nr:hypothetical protein [Okeania sp. SIO2B3]NET44591.1 hypothetical protein [Okeania sp. SIO2B3]
MADINELIEELAELDEETLQAQLGMQVQSLEDNLTKSTSVESININTLTAVPRSPEGNKFGVGELGYDTNLNYLGVNQPLNRPRRRSQDNPVRTEERRRNPNRESGDRNRVLSRPDRDRYHTSFHQRHKFIEFGQNFFKRLNGEAYDLLCGRDPFGDGGETMQKIDDAYNESSTKAAGMLAPILVTNLGLAPAIAAIVATLIVQKIASAAGETICSMWQDSFDGSKPLDIKSG